MKLLDSLLTHRLFPPAKAVEVAAQLQAGDEDGWTYRVQHDPTGRGLSFIEVYDEDGTFVTKV